MSFRAPSNQECAPARRPRFGKVSLDVLTVLTPEEAERQSVVIKPGKVTKTIEAKGVAGVAFQALADKASEIDSPGLTTLSITASADTGEGARDIDLLGKAIAMLPKLDLQVALELELDMKGLSGGAQLELSGPAPDYQRVEDAVLALAAKAADVAGTLRLEVRFATPCPADSGDAGRIRDVIAKVQPGELRLRAILA